jgi:DNA-directed RNA polymerase specialized sigma24 family protein
VEELYLKYQGPLRVHFLGKFGSFPSILKNADDLLQDFVLKKILRDGWLRRWHPGKGRFRDFLRTSLNNFVWDWWKKQPEYRTWAAQKHQPEHRTTQDEESGVVDHSVVDLPPDLPPPDPDSDPFDLRWAQMVIAEALDRLERACNHPGRPQPHTSHIWEVFRLRTLDPLFKSAQPAPYHELIKTFGLRSPTEGTNMLLSAKRMFKRHLEEVISEYSGSDNAAKSELEVLTQFVERLAKKERQN